MIRRTQVRGRRTEVGGQRQPSSNARSGQAAIEFTVALFFLLLPILLGLYHVNLMTRVSLFLLGGLRGSAGVSAMQDGALSTAPPDISNWEEGADGLRNTADDQPVLNSMGQSAALSALTGYSVKTPSDWNFDFIKKSQIPVSMISLHASPLAGAMLGFAHEEKSSEDAFGENIVVNDFLRELVPRLKSTVAIKEEVWMPLMGGLY